MTLVRLDVRFDSLDALAKYAKLVNSASLGAVTDADLKL